MARFFPSRKRAALSKTLAAVIIVVVVAAAGAGIYLLSGAQGQAESNVTFVMGTKYGPGLEWIYIAQQEGFFKKYGINATLVTLSNPATAHAALVAGQAQFEVSDLADEVIATDLQGIKTVMIADSIEFSQLIFTSPNVNMSNPATIKGATIAISAPGDFIQMVMEAIVKKDGLNPKTDVTFLAVSGGQPARIAAVKAGTAQIATCAYPTCAVAAQEGLTVGKTWDSYGVPKVANTVIVQPTWLNNHKDVATAFLKAMVDSFVFIYTNKEKTIQYAAQWDGLDPVKDRAKIISGIYLNYIQGQQNLVLKYPFVDQAEAQLHLNFAAEQNPAAANINASSLFDNSVVQGLKDSGFIDNAWSSVNMASATQLWTSS